ncbi:hypothetical protein QTP88_025350 [Uroleucon formosanum]
MTLPKITTKLPASPIHVRNSYTVPEYIEFADPTYATPEEIDLLLGAEVFFDTLRSGQYKPMANGLVYQETVFRWVVAGSVPQYSQELGKVECHSLEEKQCIEHFKKSVTKGVDGRFIVQLPFKEDPNKLVTTKLWVVFDALCTTDIGKSLNDILLKGPSIQDDLINIITRFRIHKYAMSADIQTMYRQIWIAEKDRDFRCVLWRANPEDEVKEYRLNTVTYGTSPASYLATACLKKLADDMRPLFPDASTAVTTDFYMDDYLDGAQTIDEAIKLRNEIVAITNSSGFNLRKWVSNDKRLLSGIPNDDDDPPRVLNLDGSAVKTLDSTIVLAWISSPASKWKTFVAHRVGEWEGPQWLQTDENSWPNAREKAPLPPEEMPEFKGERPFEYSIIEKYSCLQKLLRITAYCMRWKTYNSKNKRFTAEINTEEFDTAKTLLIKMVQGQYFHDEIKCLTAKQNVSKRSKLKLLCSYIDKDGTLRVGGRLNNMQSINADKRNPVLLPAQSKFTTLIFIYEHYRQLHVDPQALLATIRDQY